MYPWHPTFVPDATYFCHSGQYYSYSRYPEMRAPLRSMPEEIMQKRPPLIDAAMVERFGKMGVFTAPQSAALASFLAQGYAKVMIGDHGFWVRQDRAARFSLPPWHPEEPDEETAPEP
jgi:hypothetical protein